MNLIPYNTVEGLPWERPDEEACEAFLAALEKQKVTATLRREKGHDIDAACGQLRLKTERELAFRVGRALPSVFYRQHGILAHLGPLPLRRERRESLGIAIRFAGQSSTHSFPLETRRVGDRRSAL